MMIQSNVPNALNMYFVGDPAGNCGYFAPGPDGVAMAKSCAQPGETTTAHEVGHYFSLPHTFSGWEGGNVPPPSQQERVDGSNCNSAADGFCDTPPDYAYFRWNCPTVGPFTDPAGISFIPDGRYYMSYSNDACTDRFSPLQRSAMSSYLQGPRANLLFPTPPPIVDLKPVNPLLPVDDAEDVPFNYPVLKWSEADGAESYHVIIALNSIMTAVVQEALVTDTFFIAEELDSERRYYWKVKPVSKATTCAEYTTASKFFTSIWPSGIEEGDGPVSTLSMFPNPLSSGENLTIDVQSEKSFEGRLRVYGLDGRILHEAPAAVIAGDNRFRIPTSDWSAGMYLFAVEAEGIRAEDKFLITR
jgi:hypothetical protein